MRTSFILSLALSTLALASPTPEKRQIATIQTALQSVVTPLNALTQSVTAFTGDATTGQALTTNGAALQTALKTATTTVQGAQPLTQADTAGLQQATAPFATGISGYLKAISAKSAVFTQAGSSAQVAQGLGIQRDAFVSFSTAVANKTTGGAQAGAQQIAQLSASFDKVIQSLGGAAAPAPSAAPVAPAKKIIQGFA